MENQPQHHRGDHAEEDMDKRQATAAFAFMLRRPAEMDADQTEQTTPEHHHYGEYRA